MDRVVHHHGLEPLAAHDRAQAAARGVAGTAARRAISARTGGDVASTWPVMITSAICSVNGISSQKPLPQASIT